MEFQSKNLSSLLNSNKSIESYLSECTEYEKSSILEEAYQVDEGFGDWLKHKVAGAEKWMQNKGWSGKFFGMGQSAGGYNKADRDASRADIQGLGASLEGVPDDLKLENIKNQIFSIEPEFPNGKDKQKFLDCLEVITKAYDKIKQLHSSGELKADVANPIIDSLRKFLHHNLDAELMGVYSHFNENKKYDSEKFLSELALIERSVSGNVDDSSTMKNLSSTKLQKVLAVIGASLGLASIASYLIGKMGPDLYDYFLEHPTSTDTIKVLDATPHSVSISGHTSYIRNIKEILHASMPAHTGPWSTVDLQNGLKDAPDLFDQLNKACVNAGGAAAKLNGIASGPPMDLDTALQAFSAGGKTIPGGFDPTSAVANTLQSPDLFSSAGGLSSPKLPGGSLNLPGLKLPGPNKFGPGGIFALKPGPVKLVGTVGNLGKIIFKQIISVGTRVTGASMMAGNISAGLGAAAPFMAAGAGVALGGAALIHYLRSKGLKDSRASSLRKTIELLQNVSGDVEPRRGGEGGFRGGSRQGYGREEVITSRDFIKQMTDLLVAKAGPSNPSAPPGTPRTSQMDPSQANKIARQLKAEIDALKGVGGNTQDVIEDPRTITEARVKRSPGVVTRTAIENLITRFLAKGSNLPTPLSKKDLTKAIELAMNYSGAPKERETLRGGSTREDPINKKAFEGPVGNKIVGHIIVEMTALKDREGKTKYPNMRLQRSEYENLIKKVLETLVNGNAILKPRRLAEARIFVGNPKNSRWFKIALQIVQNDPLFKAAEKQQKPSQDTQNTMNTLHSRPLAGTDTLDEVAMAPGNRKIKPNPAQAVPFTEDLMKILIQNSLLAESKNDGENLIVERWGKLAGLLND